MAKNAINKPHTSSSRAPKYALLSVSDKTGIVEFAQKLSTLGYSIISTGGTAKELKSHGVKIIPIQEITGNPESFDGRMKTISFQIESGILFDRTNKKHLQEAETLGIKPIDIVVCNLYPFEKTVANHQVKIDDAIENIDVGGPTMIRAAAKNHKNVLVVVDPKDYEKVSEFLSRHSPHPMVEKEQISPSPLRGEGRDEGDTFQKSLAAKAFQHLSFYDSQIASYLSNTLFPSEITLAGRKTMDLRYGENPHQKGAVYVTPNAHSPFENLQQLAGRGLSLTNITDINAGYESVMMFQEPCAVVIKHNNPCGIALGKTIDEALQRAFDADPESAFGGVVVLNKKMDKKTAEIIKQFKDDGRGNMDIIAVPEIEDTALELLKQVRKSTGIYTFSSSSASREANSSPHGRTRNINLKWIRGGFVIQTSDDDIDSGFSEWKIVTQKKPTKQQMKQAQIAWKFINRIKSNSIIVVDKELPMTRGIGTGQTSRIRAVRIALEQAEEYAKDAILISDSFFPFEDSVMLASKYGISLIVQQGGSINDAASIQAADQEGIAMILTGRRAFWH